MSFAISGFFIRSSAILVSGPIGTKITSPGFSCIVFSKKSTAEPVAALILGALRFVFP